MKICIIYGTYGLNGMSYFALLTTDLYVPYMAQSVRKGGKVVTAYSVIQVQTIFIREGFCHQLETSSRKKLVFCGTQDRL